MKIYDIQKAEELLIGLKPKCKYALSFILGAISAAAMPPLGMFFVLPATISIFIILSRGFASRKQAFINGWAFGAGYFIFGFYWISYALFVDIQLWWWVLPLSLIIAPTLYALYYGFITLIAHRYRNHNTAYVFAICALMAMIEWIRGHAFTGFPWNLLGYTWYKFLPMMQANAYIGIYGLTLITIIFSVIPIIKNRKIQLTLFAIFISILLGGLYRIHSLKIETYNDVAVRIVQPNIEQTDKWEDDQKYINLRKLLSLSKTGNKEHLPIKLVIWPETATILNLDQSDEMIDIVASSLPKGSFGILGSLNAKSMPNQDMEFFNSVSILSPNKKLQDIYNKHHLVPFGEYIPYRKYLNLTPIAAGISNIGDFKRGDGVRTIEIAKDLPKISPLICYEIIFPHAIALTGAERPELLVNVTNDAWYGKSAGPYQHFEIARARAIEQGLPLVRAANTGISAIINPLGQVIAKKPLGEEGVIDSKLPKALPETLYSKAGDLPFFSAVFIMLIICELIFRRKSKITQ